MVKIQMKRKMHKNLGKNPKKVKNLVKIQPLKNSSEVGPFYSAIIPPLFTGQGRKQVGGEENKMGNRGRKRAKKKGRNYHYLEYFLIIKIIRNGVREKLEKNRGEKEFEEECTARKERL